MENLGKLYIKLLKRVFFFDGIDFWDKQNGIAFSDPIDGKFFIIKTKDGGKTWLPISPANIPAIQENEAAFAASGTSLVTVGRKYAYICTGGGKFAQVYKTAKARIKASQGGAVPTSYNAPSNALSPGQEEHERSQRQ